MYGVRENTEVTNVKETEVMDSHSQKEIRDPERQQMMTKEMLGKEYRKKNIF